MGKIQLTSILSKDNTYSLLLLIYFLTKIALNYFITATCIGLQPDRIKHKFPLYLKGA